MVEILLATYNGEKYIKRQLASIFAGTYTDFHITVRDDGSADNTVSILKSLQKRCGDRLSVCYDGEPTGSACGNFMKMIDDLPDDVSYVMFADQDDLWSRYKIEDSMELMQQLEFEHGMNTPLLVHTDLMVMDENEKVISRSLIEYMKLPTHDTLPELLLQNSVTGCTVLFNNALLQLLKRACTEEHLIMHDHFAAVVAAAFGKVACLNKSTVKYRQHSENVVGASNATSLSYKLSRLKRGKEAFRKSMNDGYEQAELLLKLYPDKVRDMNPADRELLEEYAALSHATHKERVRFFRDSELYKRSFTRAVMQMIWC